MSGEPSPPVTGEVSNDHDVGADNSVHPSAVTPDVPTHTHGDSKGIMTKPDNDVVVSETNQCAQPGATKQDDVAEPVAFETVATDHDPDDGGPPVSSECDIDRQNPTMDNVNVVRSFDDANRIWI